MKCSRVCTSILTIGLLLLIAWAGWSALRTVHIASIKTNPAAARTAGSPMPVSTVVTETGKQVSVAGAECVAHESGRVALSTEFDFRVASVETAVGMTVKKNQVIIKFEDNLLHDELKNAIEGQAIANAFVKEMEPLLSDMRGLQKKKLIPLPDMLRVVKDVGQARLDLVRTSGDVIRVKHQLAKSEIRAPFDGVVTAINVDKGSTPRPFIDLVEIRRLNPIQMQCEFSETDIETITNHNKVEVSFTAYPGRVFPAVFHQILPVLDEEKHTLSVLFRLDNKELSFLPGMHAITKVSKKLEGIFVPAISLIKPQEGSANIFVVDNEGITHMRQVKTGRYAQGYVNILAGLQEGERVVVAGQLYLLDGDKVREETGERAVEREGLFPSRDR